MNCDYIDRTKIWDFESNIKLTFFNSKTPESSSVHLWLQLGQVRRACQYLQWKHKVALKYATKQSFWSKNMVIWNSTFYTVCLLFTANPVVAVVVSEKVPSEAQTFPFRVPKWMWMDSNHVRIARANLLNYHIRGTLNSTEQVF